MMAEPSSAPAPLSQKRPHEDDVDVQPSVSTPVKVAIRSEASTPLSVLSVHTPSPMKSLTPSTTAPNSNDMASSQIAPASSNAPQPAKRRKLTQKEKDDQKLEKEAKAKAREDKKTQKEAEDRLKAEQKAAKDEEKRLKDEEKKKLEEREEKRRRREEEQQQKEEEKAKKERVCFSRYEYSQQQLTPHSPRCGSVPSSRSPKAQVTVLQRPW
jgi:chromatin assembly factor 1 subunit A